MKMDLFGSSNSLSQLDLEITKHLKNEDLQIEVYKKLENKRDITINPMELSLILKQFNQLVDRIITKGSYDWSLPTKVVIPKKGGKSRIIYLHNKLFERFYLGMLYRAFSEVFNDVVSSHVYSYKKGVSTGSTVQALIASGKLADKHCVKLDIQSFFNSVDRTYLVGRVEKLLQGSTCYKRVLQDLLFTDKVTYKGQELNEFMGLIPGSAISSFLANFILKDLDDYLGTIDNVLYARYSDDIILFADSREQLDYLLENITKMLLPAGLVIHPDKLEFFKPRESFEFLGLKLAQLENRRFSIDIGDSTFTRMKQIISNEAKLTRKRIRRGNDKDRELATLIYNLNNQFFKTYLADDKEISYAKYVFSNVNSIARLRELDFYMKERIRYAITGKNNSGTLKKVPYEKMLEFGLLSFIDMFNAYRIDQDYFLHRSSTIVKHLL